MDLSARRHSDRSASRGFCQAAFCSVWREGAGRGSWMEPRLVTVAVGDLAREVPAVRVAPRTLSVRVAEMAVFSSVSTDDAKFDRAFHVSQKQLGNDQSSDWRWRAAWSVKGAWELPSSVQPKRVDGSISLGGVLTVNRSRRVRRVCQSQRQMYEIRLHEP